MNSFFHTKQTYRWIWFLSGQFDIKTAAIVLKDELQGFSHNFRGYSDRTRIGVFDRIVDKLLNDPKNNNFCVFVGDGVNTSQIAAYK